MFANGKIYKVTSSAGLPYIGSTYLSLEKRLNLHKCSTLVYSISQHLGEKDIAIELIENYPCNSLEELRKRERYWIENIKCCNKNRPYTTKREKLDYQKVYYNNDKWKGYQKSYQENYRKTKFLRELPFHLGIPSPIYGF